MTTTSQTDASETTDDLEQAVLDRYEDGAVEQEDDLCCPTDYDESYLEVIPEEIIEKDYGCGDPTRYIETGDTVLDLGSGTGKHCYIASQVVGEQGTVIGVDFNDEMLDVARSHKAKIAERIGYDNVEFRKGKIQDLALDMEQVESWLDDHPVTDLSSLNEFRSTCRTLRDSDPLVEDSSIDTIMSNCVLNLVRSEEKEQLFEEMYRVLNRGGKAVISDIVCDEPPTDEIKNDPDLWSGCIAGAFLEDEFLRMFEDAGFYGMEILNRQEEPWQVIDGIEFRSMTVRAFKGKEGPCKERNQAVVYRGPWKQVVDDDGHRLHRGKRMAVCDKTYKIFTDPDGPYSDFVEPVPPREEIPLEEAEDFDCDTKIRHPRETKGLEYDETRVADDDVPACGPECC